MTTSEMDNLKVKDIKKLDYSKLTIDEIIYIMKKHPGTIYINRVIKLHKDEINEDMIFIFLDDTSMQKTGKVYGGEQTIREANLHAIIRNFPITEELFNKICDVYKNDQQFILETIKFMYKIIKLKNQEAPDWLKLAAEVSR